MDVTCTRPRPVPITAAPQSTRRATINASPWGNTFHVYEARPPKEAAGNATVTPTQKLAALHASWDDGMAVRGKPGVAFAEFRCAVGGG